MMQQQHHPLVVRQPWSYDSPLAFHGISCPSDIDRQEVMPIVQHLLELNPCAAPDARPWRPASHAWRTEARQAIKSLLAADQMERAHLLLGLLYRAHPGMVDNVCANLLMSEYKKRGCLSQVLHVLSQMRMVGLTPDTVTFNIAVDACGKAQQMHLAFGFLDEMRASGLTPTVNTYTSLIDACGKCGDLDVAESLLGTMLAEGVVPNTCTFTTLIQTCCRALEFERGLGFLRMLVQSERNGINSSAVVGMTTNVTVADKTPYTTLVKNSLSFGDIDTAFEGFGLMSSMLQRMGGRPEFMMLNDLVTHSLNHGRLYRALEGFHAMAAWEFSPFWDKHVSRFLNGCAHTGGQALDYASDLLRLMQVCGWHFSSFHSDLFATLFEKAAKERHVSAALAALNYDRLFAPSGFNLECDLQKATEELSDACEEAAYTGQLDRAMQALSILYAVSAKPPKALFDKLLYACGGGCDELRGRLEAHGILPSDEHSASVLLELFTKHHAFDAVGRLLAHLQQCSIQPSAECVKGLLTTLQLAIKVASEKARHGGEVMRNDVLVLVRLERTVSAMFPNVALAMVMGMSDPQPGVRREDPVVRREGPKSPEVSPVSVTTPPPSSWPQPTLLGLPLAATQTVKTVTEEEESCSTETTTNEEDVERATAVDEMEELAVALARLAREEDGAEPQDGGWWSEA